MLQDSFSVLQNLTITLLLAKTIHKLQVSFSQVLDIYCIYFGSTRLLGKALN